MPVDTAAAARIARTCALRGASAASSAGTPAMAGAAAPAGGASWRARLACKAGPARAALRGASQTGGGAHSASWCTPAASAATGAAGSAVAAPSLCNNGALGCRHGGRLAQKRLLRLQLQELQYQCAPSDNAAALRGTAALLPDDLLADDGSAAAPACGAVGGGLRAVLTAEAAAELWGCTASHPWYQ